MAQKKAAKKAPAKALVAANPMSWRRKTVWFFNKVLIALTALAYLCAWVSPEWLWIAAFLAYLIPVCFLAHLLFLYVWYKKAPIYMLYSIGTLAVGYPFLTATVAINFDIGGPSDFSVLSYNAKVFNVYGTPDVPQSQQMIDWLLRDDSDIKCIQEFYSRGGKGTFDVLAQIKRQGKYQCFTDRQPDAHRQTFGLAILSRHPIVKSGRIEFSEKTHNSAAYADIALPSGTVRVVNVHLESLHIPEEQIVDTENLEENSKNLFRKLKRAFVKRARQLEDIESFVAQSPHPVVRCGDLNDLPYSYTYLKLSRMLDSAFEEAGNGFGFSYNGKLFFLRIDNQFYGGGIAPTQYHTLRQIDFSDHFPIKAEYRFGP